MKLCIAVRHGLRWKGNFVNTPFGGNPESFLLIVNHYPGCFAIGR